MPTSRRHPNHSIRWGARDEPVPKAWRAGRRQTWPKTGDPVAYLPNTGNGPNGDEGTQVFANNCINGNYSNRVTLFGYLPWPYYFTYGNQIHSRTRNAPVDDFPSAQDSPAPMFWTASYGFHLLQGPEPDVLDWLVERSRSEEATEGWDCPHLVWPPDLSWCLVVPYHFAFALLGGVRQAHRGGRSNTGPLPYRHVHR